MRISCPLICVALVAVSASAASAVDNLAESMVLTPMGGTEREDREIAKWQQRAGAADAKPEAFEGLGWALVAKARRTLDPGFHKLAETTADAMDVRFGVSAESRLLRGHAWHNLHRFREAETVARGLVTERGAAAELALLSDALMEQGKLGEAAEVLQRLVNVKPGAQSFSRIAHVRWLKGDLAGAMDAMETARRAGDARDGEAQAWTLVRLAGFFLQAGRVATALAAAEAASQRVTDYAPALLAQGRALVALGRGAEAINPLRRAAELNPLPEYQWWLADVLRANGQEEAAVKVEVALRQRGALGDPRTLALFFATRGEQAEKAVRMAREELAVRADVHTQDALAWALAASGDLAGAEVAMRAALAEGTRDAGLFLHAGEIATALGRPAAAQAYFTQAKQISATLTPSEQARLASRVEGGSAPVRAD